MRCCSLPGITVFHLLLIAILCGGNVARAEFGGYLSRNFASLERKCENTVSGLWYLADDQSRVCPRSAFDHTSGCCGSAAPKHSCQSCVLSDRCCSSYEHCVSCCMAPQHGADRQVLDTPRGKGKPETGFWSSPFEYCRGVCRTSSRSTEHENAFIDERKYCFSQSGRPWVSESAKNRVDGQNGQNGLQDKSVIIVPSAPGRSCEEGCAAEKAVCKAELLSDINNCNVLRDTFPCEAGCATSSDEDSFPGYVTRDAGKPAWPTKCFVAAAAAALAAADVNKNDVPQMHGGEENNVTAGSSDFDCSAASGHVQRLCPCVREVALVEQSRQVDSSTDAEAQD